MYVVESGDSFVFQHSLLCIYVSFKEKKIIIHKNNHAKSLARTILSILTWSAANFLIPSDNFSVAIWSSFNIQRNIASSMLIFSRSCFEEAVSVTTGAANKHYVFCGATKRGSALLSK